MLRLRGKKRKNPSVEDVLSEERLYAGLLRVQSRTFNSAIRYNHYDFARHCDHLQEVLRMGTLGVLEARYVEAFARQTLYGVEPGKPVLTYGQLLRHAYKNEGV